MATSQAAFTVDKAVGKDDNAITQQDVANYANVGEPDETMKALVWMGRGKVELG
jgi:hypothetical protein